MRAMSNGGAAGRCGAGRRANSAALIKAARARVPHAHVILNKAPHAGATMAATLARGCASNCGRRGGGKLYGTRCGASGEMLKRLLRRADAAQECSHVGFVPVNGEFEGSAAPPAMRRVRGGIWRRARAASGSISHSSLAARSALASTSQRQVSRWPCIEE